MAERDNIQWQNILNASKISLPVSYTIKNNSLLLLSAIYRRCLEENNLEFSYDTNFHHDKSQGESKQEDMNIFYNHVSE